MNLRWATFAIAGLFLLFLILFEILPGIFLGIRALTDASGFTFVHLQEATKPLFLRALGNSLSLSLQSALEGAILGTLTAGALWSSQNPRVKNFVTAISGVAANFAGVPLAFAFVVLLGASGVLNYIFTSTNLPTIDIYRRENLHWVYLYFQWPLMTALMLPAFGAIDKSWLEAARGLGARPILFWWRVGIPVLLPTLLGSGVLLFANSFGAYATAYALSQGFINLLPTQIGFQVSGQVGYDPGAAAALSLIMAAVLLICLALYRASRSWAERLQGGGA
jgi:putative spermidine/putrescine transport system permease protein